MNVPSSSPSFESVPPLPVPVSVSKSPISASAVSSEVKKLSCLLMSKAGQYSVFHAADTPKGDYYTFDLDMSSGYKICQSIIKTHKSLKMKCII